MLAFAGALSGLVYFHAGGFSQTRLFCIFVSLTSSWGWSQQTLSVYVRIDDSHDSLLGFVRILLFALCQWHLAMLICSQSPSILDTIDNDIVEVSTQEAQNRHFYSIKYVSLIAISAVKVVSRIVQVNFVAISPEPLSHQLPRCLATRYHARMDVEAGASDLKIVEKNHRYRAIIERKKNP